MEFLKAFATGFVAPYRFAFGLMDGIAGKILFTLYLIISFYLCIQMIMSFPWLMLSLFIMGCAMPFFIRH